MNNIERVHGAYVRGRRVRILSEVLASQIPPNASVLDVGAGDGRMGYEIQKRRPDVQLQGLEVHMRNSAHIPIRQFDGEHFPNPELSHDVVMFVDVLHHAHDSFALMKEASRVARSAILIKDHIANTRLANRILKFMDRVGNERFGVALPYNYWREDQWLQAFSDLNLVPASWLRSLGIYPRPLGWIFDGNLHFIALLQVNHDMQ